MKEVIGKANNAKIFTDNVDETTINQVSELADQEFTFGEKIRIMPDCHAGAGCVVGTTMTITDKIVPNLVGVDIGCGMLVTEFKGDLDFKKLDEVIAKYVPSGFDKRDKEHKFADTIDYAKIKCPVINEQLARHSLGTLGGGNHFIEVNISPDGKKTYLVIHSGSRHLGLEVANYYQKKAQENHPELPKDLAYCDDSLFTNYLNDMEITQEFAARNREAMADEIANHMGWDIESQFCTIHNYIDTKEMIMRKGAVSAKNGELLIIPINMRDGSILAYGKGNEDWNMSAPHGAGRVLSRAEARKVLNLADFENKMSGVYTTSVGYSTIDEAPDAYKPLQDIVDNIGDTVEIKGLIKPLYNFKSHKEKRL